MADVTSRASGRLIPKHEDFTAKIQNFTTAFPNAEFEIPVPVPVTEEEKKLLSPMAFAFAFAFA